MFASVAKFRLTRALTASDVEMNERLLVPMLKDQHGYQGYFEVKAGERETIAITLWASQADAERGLEAIRPQLGQQFGAILDGPPERSFGDVLYADVVTVNA
jgi:hypothetical protein